MQRLLIPLLFVVGLALGISGTILAPRVAGRYLPEAIQGKTELVEGQGAALLAVEGPLVASPAARLPSGGLRGRRLGREDQLVAGAAGGLSGEHSVDNGDESADRGRTVHRDAHPHLPPAQESPSHHGGGDRP